MYVKVVKMFNVDESILLRLNYWYIIIRRKRGIFGRNYTLRTTLYIRKWRWVSDERSNVIKKEEDELACDQYWPSMFPLKYYHFSRLQWEGKEDWFFINRSNSRNRQVNTYINVLIFLNKILYYNLWAF